MTECLDGTPIHLLDGEGDLHDVGLTWFPGLRTPVGIPMALNLAQLAAQLAEPAAHASKEALPLWSFAAFTRAHRRLANVEQVHAVGLDVDLPLADPQGALRAVATRLEAHVLAHSTFSSERGGYRLRIIVPYATPVDGDTHRLAWRLLARQCRGLGVTVDRACSDPSRAFYVPAIPPSGAYWWGEAPGPLWLAELAAEQESRIAAQELARARPPETVREYTVAANIETRAARYLEQVEPAIAGQRGHDTTYRAALHMVRGFGLDADQAFGLMWRLYNPRCVPPWSEWELRRKCAQATRAERVGEGFHVH